MAYMQTEQEPGPVMIGPTEQEIHYWGFYAGYHGCMPMELATDNEQEIYNHGYIAGIRAAMLEKIRQTQ